MGLNIKSYDMMVTLIEPDSGDVKEIGDALKSNFSMFAFILYSPNLHKDLYNFLNKQFFDLDRKTGKRLLFLALAGKQSEWEKAAIGREYVKVLNNACSYAQPSESLWKDNEVGPLTVALKLGIPTESLPIILITENLLSKRWSWVSTNAEVLERQLISIAEEADYLPPREFERRGRYDIRELAKSINYLGAFGVNDGEKRLAESLRDVLAISTELGYYPLGKPNNIVENLFSDINISIKNNSDIKNSDDFDVSFLLNAFYKYLQQSSLQNENNDFSLNNLEPVTIAALRTASWLLKQPSSSNLDWSSSIVGIAKSLEVESNSSVIQLLRRDSGITMPDYYKKVAPKKSVKIATGKNYEVDLNKVKPTGIWHAPTLGEIANVVSSVDVPNNIFPEINWKYLKETLWNVVPQRNPAVHEALSTKEQAESVFSYFKKLEENNTVSIMCKIKNELSSGNSNINIFKNYS